MICCIVQLFKICIFSYSSGQKKVPIPFAFCSCCMLRQAKKKYLERNENANDSYRFVRVVKLVTQYKLHYRPCEVATALSSNGY